MDYSRKISERIWNLADKGELESRREETFIDDIVQKSHIEKELLAVCGDIDTVFDAGAGAGRFSILLAKRGCRVTHFDISAPMIDKAREIAAREGVLDNITFVRGAIEELYMYADRSFDLVMSFDAPISYTYPRQNAVIADLVRMARKKVMLSACPRAWVTCRMSPTPCRRTNSSSTRTPTIPLCGGASKTATSRYAILRLTSARRCGC